MKTQTPEEMTGIQWKTEFPGFDMPAIKFPEGFEDTSYRNDACPSFTRGPICIWIDWEDAHEREDPDGKRFVITRRHEDHSDDHVIMETDSWADVLMVVGWDAPRPAAPEGPVARVRRQSVEQASTADLREAADNLHRWAQQIECGNNFIHASGQAPTLKAYNAERHAILSELDRRTEAAIRDEEEREEIFNNGQFGLGA